jgi:membrane associated rhomboid family serine protease
LGCIIFIVLRFLDESTDCANPLAHCPAHQFGFTQQTYSIIRSMPTPVIAPCALRDFQAFNEATHWVSTCSLEPPLSRIPARSRREAMDLGLVLISQEIESVITKPNEVDGEGWGLRVAPADYERALRAIQQYQLENRGWPWQQEVFRPGILFDWGSLAWAVMIFLFFGLNNRHDLGSAGVMDSLAVKQGEWWRLFTAIWLHADAGHLASNATFGFFLLGLAMGRYGTGVGLLAAYLAGTGGNLWSGLLASSAHRSLGASGMVMGALGLLASQSFVLWRVTPHAGKFIVTGVVGGLMLFILMGTAPNTDIAAHAGGFVTGLILSVILTLFRLSAEKPKINLAAGFIFAALVIIPWWLALRHGSAG